MRILESLPLVTWLTMSVLFSRLAASTLATEAIVFHGSPGECPYLSDRVLFLGATCQQATKADGTNTTVIINNSAFQGGWSRGSKWIDGDGIPRGSCGISIFINETTIGAAGSTPSPSVADCLVIRQWVVRNDGYWTVTQSDLNDRYWTPLIVVESCAFAVGVPSEYRLPWGIAVGNADVGDLVRDSIKNYRSGGVVGTGGNVPCLSWTNDGDSATLVPTDWGLMSRTDLI